MKPRPTRRQQPTGGTLLFAHRGKGYSGIRRQPWGTHVPAPPGIRRKRR